MASGFRRFLDSLSDGVGRDLPLFEKEGDGEPIVRYREPNPDELALGWTETKDEETNCPVVQLVGVPQSDRATHFYVVGASGTGKTKFLQTLAVQDAKNGYGFGIVDAHSDLTEEFKGHLYLEKKDDGDFLQENVVLIDPSDPNYTVCFNPLERTDGMDTDMVVGELVEVFKKIWADAWGNRMQDLLTNTLIALVENDLTLAELPLFLRDFKFRKMVLGKVDRENCLDYFNNFNSLPPKTQREWYESTVNKVGQLLSNEKVRQMFISPKSTFSFRDVMDGRKILLVKLDRGRLKGSADLLGSLLLAKIQMTAFARTDTVKSEREMFYLYVDEFQNFAEESFIETLAQSRKYKLPLILAHQQLAQIPPVLRASILTNCALQAYFRISRADADILAKESLASVYSNPPGWESYIQLLQELPPQTCVCKKKNGGDVVSIRTMPLHDAHEIAGIDEKAFAEMVAKAEIGKNYLRSRKEVEEAYRTRRERLMEREGVESFSEKKTDVDYESLIKGGENNEVEFKMSICHGYKKGDMIKPAEYIIAKGISSFMNAEGGILFVGVSDRQEILGIENDYQNVQNKNSDGFLLQLTNIINHHLGKEFHQYTNTRILKIADKDICVVEVLRSKTPVFLRSTGKEEFFIRASASSQPMNVRETSEYIRTHFFA